MASSKGDSIPRSSELAAREVPDAELLARISAGAVDAVGALYDRYADVLYPVAMRVLHDAVEAEDVLHDAFVTVADRAAQYAPARGSVAGWLVTLVRNLAIDRARRRGRRGAIARDTLAHEPREPVPSPESLTADATVRAKVRRALATLPEVQRVTLEVAFFEGLSYPEIAAREGAPLGTIKSRAARALAALREALASEGVDFDPGDAGREA